MQKKSSVGEIHSFPGTLAGGLGTSPSMVAGTFIMQCVAMEGKGAWSSARTKKSWSMGMILRHQLSISSTDASGTVVLAWDLPVTSTRTL